MRPPFEELPLLKDQDDVGIADKGEAVAGHEGRAACHELCERLLDNLLRLRLHGAGGLIEDQQERVGEEGAGDSEPLALSPRELHPPLPDLGRVALGEVEDKVVGVGALGGFLQRFGARRTVAVAQVLRDRPIEEKRLLRHIGDPAAQRLLGDTFNVRAPDANRAGGRVPEA